MKIFETTIAEQVSVWVHRTIRFEAKDIEEANSMSVEQVVDNHTEYGDGDYLFETEAVIQTDFANNSEIEEL